MKTEKLKAGFEKFKEKTLELARRAGAKNLIIACAVLVCGIAVLLNFIFASGDAQVSGDGEYTIDPSELAARLEESDDTDASAVADEDDRDDYFSAAVLNRDKARDEAIEVLSAVVSSDSAIDEVKTKAEEDIAAIASAIAIEANIEELIKAKGFEDCVAVISGELASIIVKSDGLLPAEIAQITSIVYDQAGILPVNLTITER